MPRRRNRAADDPLTGPQRDRAAGSVRWAFAVCNQLLRRPGYRDMDREIAEGAALMGLCLAARSYEPARGTWPTHAARWVKSQVRDEARVWRRRGLTCRNGGHGGPAPPTPDVGPLDPDHAARSITTPDPSDPQR